MSRSKAILVSLALWFLLSGIWLILLRPLVAQAMDTTILSILIGGLCCWASIVLYHALRGDLKDGKQPTIHL